MIRIVLPAPEVERLDTLFRSTENRKLRDRLQIVLMAQRGRARQDIAADLGVHRKTVTRWLNAYCADGLNGLQPRKAKGQPAKIPPAPTLGVKGRRPLVGTGDCKALLYVFAVVNLVSAAVHANTLESPKDAKKRTGKSKTRQMQEAFANHLRHVGRVYPREKYPR